MHYRYNNYTIKILVRGELLRVKRYTEDSITLEFGDEISPELNKRIVSTRKYIDSLELESVVETVISYTRLVIYFDVLKTDTEKLIRVIEAIDLNEISKEDYAYRVVEIPVCYEGEYGPDLALFEDEELTADEVIERHANKEYLVYMLGFMPGFVYLGGLDEKLFKERLASPRTNIQAGSVGIAGQQTGVYPFNSPGGWNLIGRTPIKLYDLRRGEETILYDAGDRIIFRPITTEEFKEIEKEVERGSYKVKVKVEGGVE